MVTKFIIVNFTTVWDHAIPRNMIRIQPEGEINHACCLLHAS